MGELPLLTPPAPAALRAELERLVLLDLLGPVGGPEEEITETGVRDRYLVGMLAPRQQQIAPEQQDDLDPVGEDAPDDGPIDRGATQAPSMFPSSFGLTFTVDGAATTLQVTTAWGRYQRLKSETLTTEKSGAPLTVWKRQPMGGPPQSLPLVVGPVAAFAPDPEQPEVMVRGIIRRPTTAWIVTLFLVNTQVEPEKLRDSAWIFQPELRVEAPDGQALFTARNAATPQRRDLNVRDLGDVAALRAQAEDAALEMLYRHEVEFAVGHGVSTHAEVAAHDPTCAYRLTTVVVPAYEVPKTIAPTPADQPALADLVVDMQTLAEIADGGFGAVLTPLVTAYQAWLDAQQARIADPAARLAGFETTAAAVLAAGRAALTRIAAGIALLDTNAQAADAFRFANRAMKQQRIHTLYAEAVRRGVPADLAAFDVPQERSWRPFQLAFILLNLPALTDLHHPDRAESPTARADLLWFPTGGGKTEAYLGLTAYTLGIRRLQGTVAGRSGMDGVAVLMRYTLRLLTLQQFQRATTLICACELIRRADVARWGSTPFRIGLWVGQRTTPNTSDQSDEALKREHGHAHRASSVGGSGSPAQLTNCPWCGAKIQAEKGHIQVEKPTRRTLTYCGDPLGTCPFARTQSPGE
ncbi:MAG: hypothetical protein WCG26_03260, partial [Chloroflexales bacterium]